jgi:hypothetical protein
LLIPNNQEVSRIRLNTCNNFVPVSLKRLSQTCEEFICCVVGRHQEALGLRSFCVPGELKPKEPLKFTLKTYTKKKRQASAVVPGVQDESFEKAQNAR